MARNLVPDGEFVNFVSESGVMLLAKCAITDDSSKGVSQFRASGTRPANGDVLKLVYTSVEVAFKDLDLNNKYDLVEPFADCGIAFRDDDDSLSFTAGRFSNPVAENVAYEKVVEGAESPVKSKAGSCEGILGPNEVGREVVIFLAVSSANIFMYPSSNSFIVSSLLV